MSDEEFYIQAKDFSKEMFHLNPQIRFEWNMIYTCNYRCPYCFFNGKWEEYGKRNIFLNAEEWENIWARIFKKYGKCSLVITGGEPFLYPDFVQIIEKISFFHYPIHISTNGSVDLEEFANKIDPNKIWLALSFHPEWNSLCEIIRKRKYLTSMGFPFTYINMCIYPTYMSKLKEYVEAVNMTGEKLKLAPFQGEYDGRIYPLGYKNKDKEILGLNENWKKNIERKGSLCAAGMRSALILPDGKVVRCGQVGEDYIIGDIFLEDFKLMDNPMTCSADICPDLETIPIDESEIGY